jgi:hypothetical protein
MGEIGDKYSGINKEQASTINNKTRSSGKNYLPIFPLI